MRLQMLAVDETAASLSCQSDLATVAGLHGPRPARAEELFEYPALAQVACLTVSGRESAGAFAITSYRS